MLKVLKIIKTLSVILVLVCMMGVLTVSADESLQSPAYTNYFYAQQGQKKVLVEDRPVYGYRTLITGKSLSINSFSGLEDIYYAYDSLIYILDSGNGRIVVLNRDYTLNHIIDNFVFNGKKQKLSEPQGIYVSKNGEIYIADTENQRVLICDSNGLVNRIMESPKSDLIPNDFNFYPISMQMDNSGYLYVLTRGSYYGALMYDENNKFVGFFGANSVTVSFAEGFSSFINGFFETTKKLANKTRKLPYQFYDFDIDNNGFIYTVSPTETGQIKKLNLKGNNTLRYKSGIGVSSAENFDFGDKTKYRANDGHEIAHKFSSITVDDNGYIFALDSAYGKIYVYDSKCNNITVFGGGVGTGYQIGTFVAANAIESVGNDILISDYENNTITVMSQTEYGELIMKANILTDLGDFGAAEPLWNQVLTYNANRQIAYRGLSLVALNKEDYDMATKYARLGFDQEAYAAAYGQLISRFLNNNLWWIILLMTSSIIAIVIYSFKHKRKETKTKKFFEFKRFLSMSIHPIEVSQDIRMGKVGSIVLASLSLLVYYISSIGSEIWSGFMYSIPNTDFNLWFTLLGTVGVVILWVLCHWGVSTIFSGKATLKNIYISTCYSLMPLIVYNIIFIILSYIVVPSSSSFVMVLQIIAYIYFGALLVFSLINIQEYSLKKLVGVALISLAGMIAIGFLIFALLMLGQNFISFIVNIFSEGLYR